MIPVPRSVGPLRTCLPLLAAALLCIPVPARAAAEIVAPDDVAELLRQYMDLPDTLAADDGVRQQRLRAAALELLATEGYFSPVVTVRNDAADDWALVVEPGVRTRVTAVDIDFAGDLAGEGAARAERREALRKDWALPTGAPFRSPDWERAKAALLAETAATTYAAAQLADSRAEVDPDRAGAHLRLTVDSGPAYRFGPTRYIGLDRYKEDGVRRHGRIEPGTPYRRSELLRLQSALQNTSWFRSVVVETDPAAAEAADIPVQVRVSEGPAQRIGLGAGYGTDTGARGEINHRHLDFLGRGWRLVSVLRYEQKRQLLGSELDLPADENGYRPGLRAKLETTDIQGLSTEAHLLGVTRSRVKGRIETRLGLTWQREKRQPDGAPDSIDRALSLDWRWRRRALDDALNPARGNFTEFGIGGGARRLLSERDFLRLYLRSQQWLPVPWFGKRDTFSLRGEVGVTVAGGRDGIPQDFLFRAGGAQSVRGYAYQSLGVREGDAVVGGRAMVTASAEYTHWFTDTWGAAAFVDAGDAADTRNALDPVVGVGIGLRWRSVAGPLALDIARGENDSRWRLHFSLLVAF